MENLLVGDDKRATGWNMANLVMHTMLLLRALSVTSDPAESGITP